MSWAFQPLLPAAAQLSNSGYIRVWNGSEWVYKPVKYWNGSQWITKSMKYWDGSQWVLTK